MAKKSPLQKRAEACANSLENSRRPIVIEFAGLPKAGKTTTLTQVHAFLKRCGFRVAILVERASVCPIRDKKHSNFNVWTACTTLAGILERTQIPGTEDDPDILILDRGLFDSICWLYLMERLNRIRPDERKTIESFLLLGDWRKRLKGVFLMTASAADALTRENQYLPVVARAGSIMNEDVLGRMRDVINEVAEKYASHFKVVRVDTSEAGSTAKSTCEKVAENILGLIEDELQENILAVDKSDADKIMRGNHYADAGVAVRMAKLFRDKGEFIPRSKVEVDTTKVQALPIVVVQNKKGAVLRLKRREKSDKNPLHEETVIWAGGHVRREDEDGTDPLVSCAVRELEEEIRLSVEAASLRLVGVIHPQVSPGTTKHIALVYEWNASTDDVDIALNDAEFFEKRGTSLSGTFQSPQDILRQLEAGDIKEEWSTQIIKNVLTATRAKVDRDLFDSADVRSRSRPNRPAKKRDGKPRKAASK